MIGNAGKLNLVVRVLTEFCLIFAPLVYECICDLVQRVICLWQHGD